MTSGGRLVLIGGGGAPDAALGCYGPLLEAAGAGAPRVGCLVLDEGDGADYARRFADVLQTVGRCRPEPLLVKPGTHVDPARLDGLDALLVCGGLTPAYAAALAPASPAVREWVAAGRPFAGFSAGAAVAATRALVGGYLSAGRVVCPPDAAEDLEELTVLDGLGLVPFALDVHAAQWGTLGRLCAAVRTGLVPSGVAIDEDTALVLDGLPSAVPSARVTGHGAAHVVTPARDGAVLVRSLPAGAEVRLPSDG